MTEDKEKVAKHIGGGAVAGATVGAASPLYKPVQIGIKSAFDNYKVSKKFGKYNLVTGDGVKDKNIVPHAIDAGVDWAKNALVRRPGPYVKRGLAGLAIGTGVGGATALIKRKKKVQESNITEGLLNFIGRKLKNSPDAQQLGKEALDTLEARVKKGATEGMEETFNAKVKELTPKAKKAAMLAMVGIGGATAGGAYTGTKLANRKKKIKESNPMLFPFTIGIHSALAKERGKEPNCLIQEGAMADTIARILGTGKRYKGSVLSPERLGQAMHGNQKVMNQAIKLYGPNSNTMKKAFPNAFGMVQKKA